MLKLRFRNKKREYKINSLIITFIFICLIFYISAELIEQAGSTDICGNNGVWKQQEVYNLYYCSQEDVYRLCNNVTDNGRVCVIKTDVGTFKPLSIDSKSGEIPMTYKNIINPEKDSYVGNGRFYYGDTEKVSFDGEEYYINKSISITNDEDRFYIETIDGLECNFLWDEPILLNATGKTINFQQGKFYDVKCNSPYTKDGDFISFNNYNWIIDVDPSITYDTSAEWNGTFVNTILDGNTIILNESETWENQSDGFVTDYHPAGDWTGIALDTRDNETAWFLSDGLAVRYNLSDGSNIQNVTLNLGGNDQGFTFDSSDNTFWVAMYGQLVQQFSVSGGDAIDQFTCTQCSGLTGIGYDASDDTLWLMDNSLDSAFHVQTDGTNLSGGFSTHPLGSTTPSTIIYNVEDDTLWVNDVTTKSFYHTEEGGANLTGGFSATISYSGLNLGPNTYDYSDNSLWYCPSGHNVWFISHAGHPYVSEGSYTSLVENAGYSANWTNITFTTTEPSATINVSVSVRSCNDAACSGESWSSFYYGEGFTWNLTQDANQYFQYNVSLATSDTSQTSVLESLTLEWTTAITDTDYPIFSNYSNYPSNASTYVFGQIFTFNATINNTNGSAILEFNGVNYTAFNSTEDLFSVNVTDLSNGTYPYNWGAWGNGSVENYNSSQIKHYDITQATGDAQTFISGSRANTTGTVNSTYWINASRVAGDGNFSLEVNGQSINSSFTLDNLGYLFNFTNTTNYNITTILKESTNYTRDAETFWINISSKPVISNPTNFSVTQNESVSHQFTASGSIDNWEVNDSTYFKINSTGYFENATLLDSIFYHEVNVSVNDTSGQYDSVIIGINVTSAPNTLIIDYREFMVDEEIPDNICFILKDGTICLDENGWIT